MRIALLFSCMVSTFSSLTAASQTPLVHLIQHTAHEYEATVTIPLADDDVLYADYLDFSVDCPGIAITSWQITQEPLNFYDAAFKEHKKAYKGPVIAQLQLAVQPACDINASTIHCSYYPRSRQHVVHETIALGPPITHAGAPSLATAIDIPEDDATEEEKDDEAAQEALSWSEYLSNALLSTNSLLLQLLIIFILGLLMSLTPCIYPMIPITAGILQAQNSRSLLVSFLLALSYTLGIATTFAILGLLAAFTGTALGSLMLKPWFLLPIVALLAYLAFAMLGWYEMYIPRFMQPKNHKIQPGSFISAFTFGAISGTVASPCLSPGLMLLLSVVAALKNIYLGFIMLFVFGMGLGIPLLIIGTFSNSLHLLPRAGMWMIEIKKIFGILMLGMCGYFLHYLLPLPLILWTMTLALLISGVLYLYNAQKSRAGTHARIQSFIGIGLIALSVVLCFKSYQTLYWKKPTPDSPALAWHTDFDKALELARAEHKPLLVDIGTPVCSICKAIDRTLFADKEVIKALASCVITKIDGSRSENKSMLMHYNVIGFPAILLINPTTEKLMARWGPELYGKDSHEFIEQLQEHVSFAS